MHTHLQQEGRKLVQLTMKHLVKSDLVKIPHYLQWSPDLITPFILVTLNEPAPICPAISHHGIFKPVVMKPAEWISDLPQWEWWSLADQIKTEEWMLWMWPCSFLYLSLHSSIYPYTHSCFPLVGCTLIRIREDFCQEIFLKQHLKIHPSDQAKSLNSSPSTLMRSQRFGPFSPMKCWCLDDPCWEVLCAYYRSQTAVLKQMTTFAFPQDTWIAGFIHWTSLPS